MNNNFSSAIQKIANLDYANRILFFSRDDMLGELSDLSEAWGEEATFDSFDLPDNPDALYICAYSSTHESRYFCTASYMSSDSAFRAALDWAYGSEFSDASF